MQELREVELSAEGAVGDREFFLVDGNRAMISATRLGPLLEIVPEYLRGSGSGKLLLNFPDDSVVGGQIETGSPEEVTFFGMPLRARPVLGPFSEAISTHCRVPLRLMARPEDRPGVDRGAIGGTTLLGVGSLARLQAAAAGAGEPGRIDQRRFRMTFGIEGIEPHQEDLWINELVRVGQAEVQVRNRVGRCAATTRDPESGDPNLKTLHHIRSYRDRVISDEPLPFGVFASVQCPGKVRLGDPVVPVGPGGTLPSSAIGSPT